MNWKCKPDEREDAIDAAAEWITFHRGEENE